MSDHALASRHRLIVMAGITAPDVVAPTRRRLPRPRLLAGALLVGLTLGGCGSSDARAPSSAGPRSAPRTAAGLFHQDCQLCHALTGPATRAQQGGTLAGLRATPSQTAAQIAEMPRLHGPLTPRQVTELTRYVLSVTRR